MISLFKRLSLISLARLRLRKKCSGFLQDYWLVRHREVSTATRSFRIPRSSPGRCFVGSGGARGGDRGVRGVRDVLNRKRDFLP